MTRKPSACLPLTQAQRSGCVGAGGGSVRGSPAGSEPVPAGDAPEGIPPEVDQDAVDEPVSARAPGAEVMASWALGACGVVLGDRPRTRPESYVHPQALTSITRSPRLSPGSTASASTAESGGPPEPIHACGLRSRDTTPPYRGRRVNRRPRPPCQEMDRGKSLVPERRADEARARPRRCGHV